MATIGKSGNCARPRTGGWGSGAARDPAAIAASSRDVCLTDKVSVKQTLEPAPNVLSSSVITGEGINDSNCLAYHTFDGLQSVSIMESREASSQGEGAVAGAQR